MEDRSKRRRFLAVLGGGVVAMGAGCGGDEPLHPGESSAGGEGGAGAGPGVGGNGGTGAGPAGTGGAPVTCVIGVAAGTPETFVEEGLHLVADTKILIGRDSGGLYALSSVCTHKACDMNKQAQGGPLGTVTATGIKCRCHGSTFDNSGNVKKGPATKPLPAYALTLCEGTLYVDTSIEVSSSTRLVV